ncbi:MAG TPA: translation initiation factor IF-2, partial [Actinomycetota bacterium]
ELGVSSKEIIDRLGDLGVEVKSHASTLDADAIGKLRAVLNGPRNASARRGGPASTPPSADGGGGRDGTAPGRRGAQSQPATANAPRPASQARPAASARIPVSTAAPAPAAPAPAPAAPPRPAAPAGSGSRSSPAPAQRPQGGQGSRPAPGKGSGGSGGSSGGAQGRTSRPGADRGGQGRGRFGGGQGSAGGGGRAGGGQRHVGHSRHGQRNAETARAQVPEPPAPAPVIPASGPIRVPRAVTVEEFASRVGRPPAEIIKLLLQMGELKTISQSLSDEAVELLADELGVTVEVVSPEAEPEAAEAGALESPEESPELLETRPPVVTVMGHVDHGKSSILQWYRKQEMLSLEAGGITQAIGAYRVHSDGRMVTFIDTPGHQAFTQMRARGAEVTDLVILVVAADDGVQPQTIEALDHAKAAHVPVIVAVNKIDKDNADPTRVRQQLAELGLQPEEWGGDTIFVDVAAKHGTNLDELLDMVYLVSDLQELKANPKAAARGVAIEAHLDKGRGPVATLIVQKGSLRIGAPVVCGPAWCKVRSMVDDMGQHVGVAGPSQPVQVSGWSRVPTAGDEFRVVHDEREAKRIAQEREARVRQAEYVAAAKPVSLLDLLAKTQSDALPELRMIVKADTQGSVEALVDSLEKMDQAKVRLTVLRSGVGAITEN